MSAAFAPLNDDHDLDPFEIALFELAMAAAPQDREALLLEACPEAAATRRRVLEMIEWEVRMGGFLETPFFRLADDARPFVPGDVVIDRFEIRREIAEGGMAIVYQALDLKTGRDVALKCPKPAFRKRLVGELCNALLVTHPNICRLHEVHSALDANGRPFDFLTMEHLSGLTLAARLRAGRFTDKEARAVARQICVGLAEAHAHDVVHGDLKPNNVILAEDPKGVPRAVITDFGLAQALGVDGTTSPWGASLRGAADYIAPERWRGGPASKASDVYALGVLLFEMLTGTRPNPPGTVGRGLVPRSWRKVVRHCLAADPDRRPEDAAAVLALLPGERSFLARAAILILLFAGVAFAGWRWTRTPVIPDIVRLAVLTADTDAPSSVIGNGVALDLSERLRRTDAAGKPLVVIPVEKSTRFHVRTVDAAQNVFGATHSLSMRWRARDDGFVVEGAIVDARAKLTVREFQRFFPRSGLGSVVDFVSAEASSALRRGVAAGAVPASYADYAAGIYYLRHAHDAGQAREVLTRVARQAPDDVWTRLRLAQADLAEHASTKSSEALAKARERLDAVRDRAASAPDTALALASLEAGANRWERAAADYSRWTGAPEWSGRAWRGLAEARERLGKLDEAELAWSKAIDAEPGYFQARMDLGVLLYYRGNYAAARDQFALVTKSAPGLAIPHFDLAAALVDLGEYGPAEQEYHQALAIEEDPDTLTGIGALLAYQARHAESSYYYERSVASGPEDPLRLSNLADSYRRTSRSRDAEVAYQRAADVARRELEKDPSDASTRSIRAWALANLGRRNEALREIHAALSRKELLKVRKRAVLVFDALGMRTEAFRMLEDAPSSFFAELSRYPDLSSFTASPRFIEMKANSKPEQRR